MDEDRAPQVRHRALPAELHRVDLREARDELDRDGEEEVAGDADEHRARSMRHRRVDGALDQQREEERRRRCHRQEPKTREKQRKMGLRVRQQPPEQHRIEGWRGLRFLVERREQARRAVLVLAAHRPSSRSRRCRAASFA